MAVGGSSRGFAMGRIRQLPTPLALDRGLAMITTLLKSYLGRRGSIFFHHSKHPQKAATDKRERKLPLSSQGVSVRIKSSTLKQNRCVNSADFHAHKTKDLDSAIIHA